MSLEKWLLGVAFNSAIQGAPNLLSDLEQNLLNQTDTEVILHSYNVWASIACCVNCVARLPSESGIISPKS